MRKKTIITLLLLVLCGAAWADDGLDIIYDYRSPDFDVNKIPDSYIDTVNINKKIVINDYSMLGVQYGVSLCRTDFFPEKHQRLVMYPDNFGIYYVKYAKMFGYMPYFGFKAGINMGSYGFKLSPNNEGFVDNLDGAYSAKIKYVEIPILSQFHLDVGYVKLMAEFGFYAGRRYAVERYGLSPDDKYKNMFRDYEIKTDYGYKGGLGFGLIFSPFELHFNVSLKYSLSSLHRPDYISKEYYRYSYPMELVISSGIYFQLSKRTGLTKKQIKNQAYNIVFPKQEEHAEDKKL